MSELHEASVYLERISKDFSIIRKIAVEFADHFREAEKEIPDKIHRFVLYMHDIREISRMYQELGHSPPDYVVSELERCDDRLRHLLEDLHTDGGTFEKVRREMSERSGNRWDHARAICKPKECCDETGNG